MMNVSTSTKLVLSLLAVAALVATRLSSSSKVSNESWSRDDEMMMGNMDLFYYVLPASSKATLRVRIVLYICMALLH
jgi:hypothetical protein